MEEKRINLNGAPVTPGVLVQVANALEEGKAVYILNAAIPNNGPGLCAMQIGYALREAEERKETINQ